MKNRRDTAGHELAKGEENEKERNNAEKALAKAKQQEASSVGKNVWSVAHRAYFFNAKK